jgi:hypothetical protein
MHVQSLAYLTHVKLNRKKAYVSFEGQQHAPSNQTSKQTQKNEITKKQSDKKTESSKTHIKLNEETKIKVRQRKTGSSILPKMRINQPFLGFRPPASLVNMGMPKLRVSRSIHCKGWRNGRESPTKLREKNSQALRNVSAKQCFS